MEKKTLDGWAIIQSCLMAVITGAAMYVAGQINHLNESVMELNKTMSAVVADTSNQKEAINRLDKTIDRHDVRIRTLEIKNRIP